MDAGRRYVRSSLSDHLKVLNTIQGMTTVIAFLLLIAQVPLAASQRNLSLTSNDTDPSGPFYVWSSRLKTEENCLKFHDQDASRKYFVWPEADFRYCCSDHESENFSTPSANRYRLRDFVYHQHSGPLCTGEYHDLVRVDKCSPYWRCWNSEAVDLERSDAVVLFVTICESGDLRRLYTHRLWGSAIAKAGILMSALPLIALLEAGVLLTTIVLGLCRLVTSPWSEVARLWWRTIAPVKLRSWLHLTLLTVVGNCFVEAIGHQAPSTWETMAFDNFTKVYLVLTLVVTVAYFTQQVVDWRLVDKCIRKTRERTDESSAKFTSTNVKMMNYQPKPEDYIDEASLHAEFMDAQWRWQPIFMHSATLTLQGLYIRYASPEMRANYASLMLAVAVASTVWSALTAIILFSRKLNILSKSFKRGFPTAYKMPMSNLDDQKTTKPGSTKPHQQQQVDPNIV